MALMQRKTLYLRLGGVVAAATMSFFSAGCAQMGGLPDLTSMGGQTAATSQAAATPEDQLAEATAYWGQQYSKNPTDLDSAMSYAKNLKAMGEKQKALAVLQQVATYHGDKQELASEYGRLALDLGQVKVAEKVLAIADNPSKPDWRIVSARGTVLAKQGRYAEAIEYYDRALLLKPDHPSLLNNLAMAHAMGGDPVRAENMLRQAVASGGDTKRVRQNLALVLGLQGRYSESAQIGAQDQNFQTASADTAAIKKLVALDPVEAPQNAGGTQLAAQPQFKGSTQDSGAGTGWNTAVAQAR